MTRGEGRLLTLEGVRDLARLDRRLRSGSRLTQHNALYLTRMAAQRVGVAPAEHVLREWAPEVAAAYLEELSR